MANAAGVSAADVVIVKVENINRARFRRLLEEGIRVDFTVKTATRSDANKLKDTMTEDNINEELSKSGLPNIAIVEAPTVEQVDSSTSMPSDTADEGTMESRIAALEDRLEDRELILIIVVVVGSVLLVLMGAVLVIMRLKKYQAKVVPGQECGDHGDGDLQTMTSKLQAPRSEGEPSPSNPSEAACLGPCLSTSQINSQVALDVKNLGAMQLNSETAKMKLEDIDENCQTASANSELLLLVVPGQVCSSSLHIEQGWNSGHSLTMSAPLSNSKSTAASGPSLDDESGVDKTTAAHSQDISAMNDISLGAQQIQSATGEWKIEDIEQGWQSENVNTKLYDSRKKCEQAVPEVEIVPAADVVVPVEESTGQDRMTASCTATNTKDAGQEAAQEVENMPAADAVESVDTPNKSEAQSRTSTGQDRMTTAFTATNTKEAGQRKPSKTPLTKASAPRLTTPLRNTSESVNRRGGRDVEAGAPSSASLRRVAANVSLFGTGNNTNKQ